MWPTFYIPGLARGESDLTFVGAVTLGCFYHTIVFTPQSQVPACRAGDLFVIVVHGDADGANDNFVNFSPDVFERYLWSSMNINRFRQYGGTPTGVFYKFLTSDDLDDVFTITHGSGTNNNLYEICARAYVFRNASEDVPLDCFTFTRTLTRGSTGAPMALQHGACASNTTDDYQFVIGAIRRDFVASGVAWPSSLVELSPPLADTWAPALRDDASGRAYQIRVGLRETGPSPPNLFASEDWADCCSGWAPVGLNSNAMMGSPHHYRRIESNGVNTRHYIETEVALTAGERYSWHTLVRIYTTSGSSSAPFGALTVVTPASDEFGIVIAGNGTTNGAYIAEWVDPLADHKTNWYAHMGDPKFDGIPNDHQPHPCSVHFIAPTTGTYKFRVSVGTAASWAGMTHTVSGELFSLYRTGLFAGYQAPIWSPSGGNAALDRQQGGTVYFCDGATPFTGEGGSYSFVVVKKESTVRPAILLPYHGTCGGGMQIEADGLTARDPSIWVDESCSMLCTRQVYPKISGVEQAYYAEITIDAFGGGTGGAGQSITVQPLHGSAVDAENDMGEGVYGWRRDGNVYYGQANGLTVAGTAWSVAVGTVLGVLVDYANREIKFYRNGTLASTVSMVTAAGREHHRLPFSLIVNSQQRATGGFLYTANFTGPFGGRKPSGARAWDWVNEVV